MYRPPYWSHGNIKFSEKSIDRLRSSLSEVELIDNHKTSFHSESQDEFLNVCYGTVAEEIVRSVGLFHKSTYTYTFWSQSYDKGNCIKEHNHVPSDISWVHFLDVPKKKCFRFTDTKGNTLVPDEQENGDIICFPSWLWHETIPTDEHRLIVSGNINFTFY